MSDQPRIGSRRDSGVAVPWSGGPMTLPTYRPDAICAKCGHDDIYTSYQDDYEFECSRFPEKPQYQTHEGEHLHRGCRRCQWKWGEAVLSYGSTSLASPSSSTGSSATAFGQPALTSPAAIGQRSSVRMPSDAEVQEARQVLAQRSKDDIAAMNAVRLKVKALLLTLAPNWRKHVIESLMYYTTWEPAESQPSDGQP